VRDPDFWSVQVEGDEESVACDTEAEAEKRAAGERRLLMVSWREVEGLDAPLNGPEVRVYPVWVGDPRAALLSAPEPAETGRCEGCGAVVTIDVPEHRGHTRMVDGPGGPEPDLCGPVDRRSPAPTAAEPEREALREAVTKVRTSLDFKARDLKEHSTPGSGWDDWAGYLEAIRDCLDRALATPEADETP
jgi:hypothetical protein